LRARLRLHRAAARESEYLERISACELVSDDEGMRLIRYLDERGYRPEDCC